VTNFLLEAKLGAVILPDSGSWAGMTNTKDDIMNTYDPRKQPIQPDDAADPGSEIALEDPE
jgi:hypothetical protein